MKGILIDPTNCTVEIVEGFDARGEKFLDEARKLINCQWIEFTYPHPTICMVVDEEGLLANPNPNGYFRLDGIDYTYAGKALLIGPNDDDGYNVDLNPTDQMLAKVRALVTFIVNPDEETITPHTGFISFDTPEEMMAHLEAARANRQQIEL